MVFVAPLMAPHYSPVDLTAGRFAAYGLIAAGIMLAGLRSRRFPTPGQAAAALVMSLLGFTGYYLLLVLAIRDAGAEVPTLIIGTIPIWVMVLGKPSHLRWGALLPGVLLTLAGLGLMMGSPLPEFGVRSAPYWRGIALAAASLACWTAFALLNSSWLKRHPQVNATDWANWLGVASGLGGVALWLLAGTPAAHLATTADWQLFVLVCIATGLGSAWFATVLWNTASRRLSASLCGQLIVSETLFALLYSFAWEARWPTFVQLAACVLFTLGILASIKAHQ
jgi:drug/metabolite transporter (DMT)-like permease